MKFAVFALVLIASIGAVGASDAISSLPDAPAVPFNQFSGYVSVNETGRKLFYWFVEAEEDPSSKPVFLWLNGGPGCSSLGGLLSENGPFFATKTGLELNPNSWNKVANVIYLESPAGVGFSAFTSPGDNNVGDERTSHDSLVFLNEFFRRHPQFVNNDFWVTGESYGGHYVPNLALAIYEANQMKIGQHINLKGFMVGNAWTVPALDNSGAVEYWCSHALNSHSTRDGLMETCDFAHIGPLRRRLLSSSGKSCNDYLSDSHKEMGNVNIYEIYADVCLQERYADGQQLLRHLAASGSSFAQAISSSQPSYDPCIGSEMNDYLNRKDVQVAIHAIGEGDAALKWDQCSPTLNYSYSDLLTPMLPVYESLLNTGVNMLVYSGDVDGIVPYTGTSEWVRKLALKEKSSWRSWTDSDGQVGGYVTEYEGGLTFTTIRNAGHMVPYTQPVRALDMVSRFPFGKPF